MNEATKSRTVFCLGVRAIPAVLANTERKSSLTYAFNIGSRVPGNRQFSPHAPGVGHIPPEGQRGAASEAGPWLCAAKVESSRCKCCFPHSGQLRAASSDWR